MKIAIYFGHCRVFSFVSRIGREPKYFRTERLRSSGQKEPCHTGTRNKVVSYRNGHAVLSIHGDGTIDFFIQKMTRFHFSRRIPGYSERHSSSLKRVQLGPGQEARGLQLRFDEKNSMTSFRSL